MYAANLGEEVEHVTVEFTGSVGGTAWPALAELELLQEAGTRSIGLHGLLDWLQARIAHADDGDETQLLRLESLGGLFNQALTREDTALFWQRFFNSPKDLHKTNLSAHDSRLFENFIRAWNNQRTQARPLFATTLRAFGGNLDALLKQDWPHLLRDRLGLSHWPSTLGKPLPVALMCYSLDEVRQALAEELLATGGLTLEEIAERLGYGEVSNFIHAFKRWKGVAPRRFQRGA